MSSTATAAIASEIDLWRRQTRMVRDVVGVNVNGLTHEESLVQPNSGGNCLNWIMGHLLAAYANLLPLLGQEQVLPKDTLKRYARGSAPITSGNDALDFGRLTAGWNQASERVEAGLGSLTPDILAQPVPNSPSGNPNETVRTLITTLMFHQAYHAGQTAVLRRIAGREGAIR